MLNLVVYKVTSRPSTALQTVGKSALHILATNADLIILSKLFLSSVSLPFQMFIEDSSICVWTLESSCVKQYTPSVINVSWVGINYPVINVYF
jgi:hypothetical protein